MKTNNSLSQQLAERDRQTAHDGHNNNNKKIQELFWLRLFHF